MGQSYIALEPERNEYILPNVFGSGAKRQSIIASGISTLDALAIMICDTGHGGRRPADVHIGSRTGRWAGRRVVIQGEHGSNGDTPGWKGMAPEDEAYDHARNSGYEMGASMVTPLHRVHGMAAAHTTVHIDGRKIRQTVAIGLRREGDRLVVDDASNPGEHLEAMRRQVARRLERMRPESYVLDACDGARRIIANLDRREYIDPQYLAEIPTMAGMMRGHLKRWRREDPESTADMTVPTALGLLGRMLFKPDPIEDDVLGRWRGDRVLITSETSRCWPTTAEVAADRAWRDITPRMADAGIDWMAFHRRSTAQRYGDIGPDAA